MPRAGRLAPRARGGLLGKESACAMAVMSQLAAAREVGTRPCDLLCRARAAGGRLRMSRPHGPGRDGSAAEAGAGFGGGGLRAPRLQDEGCER